MHLAQVAKLRHGGNHLTRISNQKTVDKGIVSHPPQIDLWQHVNRHVFLVVPVPTVGTGRQHLINHSAPLGLVSGERLSKARALLREHGQYDWLTAKGGYVVLNNGIEFGVTYLVMLLVLFFPFIALWMPQALGG